MDEMKYMRKAQQDKNMKSEAGAKEAELGMKGSIHEF